MLQYLLNATAIWMLSLLMYELLLRREAFHNYNRFYLLFTFLLGALFPLVQMEDYTALYSNTNAVQEVISVKQNIVAAATAKNTDIDWEQWLWIVYLTGIVASSILLVAEVIRIVRLYRKGNKNGEGIFIVIETGKEYAPFSIFNLLFVNARKQYNAEEWKIIIAHERQHTRLAHFMDMLLMQCGRIVFWFHPLVYIYNKRLLMVHEYQADSIAKQAPKAYGHFLIEQSILGAAPALSHSFNRSPIKNRIVMLTRNSSRAARIKMLVFIPLILACGICFSQNASRAKAVRKGDVVSYNGNDITLSKQTPNDTAFVENPVTGEMEMKIMSKDQVPEKLNGRKIYSYEDGTQVARFTDGNGSLVSYLYKELKSELGQLPDGKYMLELSNIVINTTGKIVYYDYNGFYSISTWPNNSIPENLKKSIADHMMRLLNKVTFKPAEYDGKKVPYFYYQVNSETVDNPVIVKDHKAKFK